jgi:hypothetical protein
MANATIETVPRGYARMVGAFYLMVILLGGFSEGYVRAVLIVPGDAAATAHRILAATDLWQLSVAGNLLVPLIATLLKWMEYLLLRPVNRNLALLNLILTLVSLGIEAVSKVFLLSVLPVLHSADTAGPFTIIQTEAVALMAYDLHNISFNMALMVFGGACLVCGRLVFLSKLVGLLLQAAGVSYLILTSVAFFAPDFGSQAAPTLFGVILLGEASYCLWLLLMGIDLRKRPVGAESWTVSN